MAKKSYTRYYDAECRNPDCPQPGDTFEIRYRVEEENGGIKVYPIRKDRGIDDAEPAPQVYQTKSVIIQHKCPWCGVVNSFSVPL